METEGQLCWNIHFLSFMLFHYYCFSKYSTNFQKTQCLLYFISCRYKKASRKVLHISHKRLNDIQFPFIRSKESFQQFIYSVKLPFQSFSIKSRGKSQHNIPRCAIRNISTASSVAISFLISPVAIAQSIIFRHICWSFSKIASILSTEFG